MFAKPTSRHGAKPRRAITKVRSLGGSKKKAKPRTPQDVSTQISSPGSTTLIWIASKTLSADTRVRVYERLASPLAAGVGIQTAIGQLYQRAAFKSETETVAIMLRYVLYCLNDGRSVSDGLAKFIPLNELLLIKAGESKGELAPALTKAANAVRSVQKIRSAVTQAALKPSLLIAMLFVAMYIIGSFVVPKIAVVLPTEEWQGGAAALAVMSGWTNSIAFPISILSIIGFCILVLLSQKRWAGNLRTTLDKVPPYSLYRVLQGAGWLTTLSAMLQSGRSIKECLQELHGLAVRDGNKYMASRTLRVIRENEMGAENIGIAMERTNYEFPDSEIIADLVMQSSLSNFDHRIGELADDWIEQSVLRVQRLAGAMTGISLIAVGAFVATFVMGVLSLNQQLASSMAAF